MEKAASKLTRSRFRGSEFVSMTYSASPEDGTPYERLFQPEYWSMISATLRPGDEIKVIPENFSYRALLLVVSATKTGAVVKELSRVMLDDADDVLDTGTYFIKYCGPIAKHRIYRKSDNAVMAEGISTKTDAAMQLAELEKSIAA
jgi:hypothetical protein